MANGNGTIEYGDFKVNVSEIPEPVRNAALQTWFSHKMGNEVQSAAIARIRGKDGLNSPDATKEAVAAWREANKDTVEAWYKELRSELVSKILAGTVGVRAETGPRKDPVEREFDSLVLAELRAILGEHKIKLPKDDSTVITFADGSTRTRSQMIANVAARKGDEFRKQAERIVREKTRLATQASKAAQAVETVGAEALGL